MENVLVKRYREEAQQLREQLAKANDAIAEIEAIKEALEESLNGCTKKVLDLSKRLAKANERIKELESDLIRKSSAFNYIDKHASNMTRRLANVDEQLAKANERVSILEKERDHSQRMYNSLLGDLSAGYGALSIPECESQLNKFAIEQQIKALEAVESTVLNFSQADEPVSYEQALDEHLEQLRKEQEK